MCDTMFYEYYQAFNLKKNDSHEKMIVVRGLTPQGFQTLKS